VLPSNTLRWYIEFSSPMETGNALAHVHLLDEAGREVKGAFLALDQELWDPERRRVTLLFDPGRVKRGVRTNEESGAPLVDGRRYRLVVDDSWPDGTGAALASGAELAFAAGGDDRRSPDPAQWRLTIPSAGTRDGLAVAFGESLDHALAQRMVTVYDMLGTRVGGTVTLAANDSVWVFSPERAWSEGDYSLHVDSALEDVAGNSVAQVFDTDRRVDSTGARTVEGQATRMVRFRVPRAAR
jgi:hypothetical protein